MKKVIFTGFVVLGVILGYQPAMAQLYIWTDKDGVKHYTNTAPPPEADDTQERDEAVSAEPTPAERLKAIEEKYERLRQNRAKKTTRSIKKSSIITKPTRRVVTKPGRPFRISFFSVDPDGKNHINISGRVEGGEYCPRLRIEMFPRSEQGGIAHVVCYV